MSAFERAFVRKIRYSHASQFWSVAGIKFFIVFVLTLTRDTKDTLMVTQCGAESIGEKNGLGKR